MSNNTVWLLSIEHRHGVNYSAHITESGAERGLLSHVAEWWDDEMQRRLGDDLPPMPEEPQEAIAAYFAEIEDEFWTIEEIPVLP